MNEITSTFKSKISLKFTSAEIETSYQNHRNKTYRYRNILLQLVLFILALAVNILANINNYLDTQAYFFAHSLGALLTVFVGLVVSSISKSICVNKFMCYITFIISLSTFGIFRYYLSMTAKVDATIFSVVLGFEELFRLLYFLLGCLDFVEGLFCFAILILFNTISLDISLPYFLWYRAVIANVMIIFTCALSYMFVYEKRKLFYLNYNIEKKNKKYLNILENMSSGFVSLTETTVKYINNTLNKILETSASEKTLSTENLSSQNTFNQVKKLLSRMTDTVLSKDTEASSTTYDISEIYNYLTKASKVEENKFHYLGNTACGNSEADNNMTKTYFEVFGRMINEGSEDRFEFLFNDVTRVKQQEEANADFRYKTLFLAKVAHEFKNPILCITELVEEITEKVESNNKIYNSPCTNDNSFTDILKQIKSISDYLLILIKDLDYFSQKSVKQAKNVLEYSQVKLEEVTQFCSNIVHSLIKKLNKVKDVAFTVNIKQSVPRYLITDEIKLKEVLINLLSNSVKYTYKGLISLTVDYINGEFKFFIKDTGKGLSEKQKSNIFIPFTLESSHTLISTGLGLHIVKEIIELMGGSINYISELGMGSEFWFNIPASIDHPLDNEIALKKEDNNNNSIFSSTTFEKDFQPIYVNCDMADNSIEAGTGRSQNVYNILVVDDEELTRKSAIRLIKQYCLSLNITVNIIEASDGIECLYHTYYCLRNNIKLSFILSDENMNFVNGTYCAEILNKMYSSKGLGVIKFYMLTAYEHLNINIYLGIDQVFIKPLGKRHIDDIFKDLST
jgi:signal transduction histidine kinase